MLSPSSSVPLYNATDFDGMRRACQLSAGLLDRITEYVVPGVTTGELNDRLHAWMLEAGAVPATLGYRGYPKASCISPNHVVCHGIPGDKKLLDGDIINIDTTVILDGWFGDTSRMYTVGNINAKARKLIDVTYDAMMLGIAQVKPGNTLGDVGHAIQAYAESHRFSVVRDFCGHGVGRAFHTEPQVLHFGKKGEGVVLQEGMIFTIEPMINVGTWQVKVLNDGWTAVTRDRQLSAQFEHTVGVTKDGCEIFTLSPLGHTKPPYESSKA